MARYKIITLVDITRSQPQRSETDRIKLGQQANFNSLVQAIGLRSNVEWIKDPKKYIGKIFNNTDMTATHWVWEFDTEREDVFLKGNDPVGLLNEDLHGVPVVNQLENSVEIFPAVFHTKTGSQNTWISII
jgi:hypothetical protein